MLAAGNISKTLLKIRVNNLWVSFPQYMVPTASYKPGIGRFSIPGLEGCWNLFEKPQI